MRWFITPTVPSSLSPPRPAERVRCARCADVIGMYEGIVVGDGPNAYVASLFTHPELMSGEQRLCHRACAEACERGLGAA